MQTSTWWCPSCKIGGYGTHCEKCDSALVFQSFERVPTIDIEQPSGKEISTYLHKTDSGNILLPLAGQTFELSPESARNIITALEGALRRTNDDAKSD